MQIVINIPEEIYIEIQCGKMYHFVYDIPQESVKAIKNGVPIQKGHGRLIDSSELYKKLFINKNGEIVPDRDIDNFEVKYGVHYIKMAIHDAPTIIEADKGDD